MTYRAWLGLLLVVPLLGLSACTPESRNTLPDENRIAPDARLLGQWRAEPDSDDFRIHVSRRDGLEFSVATTETVGGGAARRIHKVEYRLRAFDVGGRSILAVQELGRDPAWRFVIYRLSGDDSVTLFTMDESPVRQLIEAGRLPGTVSGAAADFAEVMITASPARLVALIRDEDAARLFSTRLGPFVRETR